MAGPIESLIISAEQRRELERIVNAPSSEQRLVRRARIVLLRADGRSQVETAGAVDVNHPVVIRWERSFARLGLAGLEEAPRRGRKPSIPNAKKEKVLVQATQPPSHRTRWNVVRSMARQVGVSPASVQGLWEANEIKPHLTRTFKLSRDPNFEAKFWDVIGLFLNPPDRALVLCCDEKSQCQALERTQPGLALGLGHVCTRVAQKTPAHPRSLRSDQLFLDEPRRALLPATDRRRRPRRQLCQCR